MQSTTQPQHLDMLNGPIWNKLPRYALPVAATGILGQLFNAADIAVVGNFTGNMRTAAVAAVGANSPIISLILNLFIGIALGANVIIANAIGRDDRETVHRAVHTSLVMALIGGVLVAIFGQLIAAGLMNLLNVPDDVYPLALAYLRIYLLGMPVILLYNFEAAIFRSVGDTKVPLIALTASGVLNVILNLFFVIVLKMNVNGVAIATVLSNAVSSALLLRRLLHGDLVRVELRQLRIDPAIFRKIMRIGLPAGIQGAIFSVSNIIVQSAINSLGTIVMAASSAAFNIEVIAYNVVNSFSQACTTFVGQNYGAGKIDRCRKTMLLCLGEDIIASAIAIVLVLLTGKYLLAFFNNDPLEVLRDRLFVLAEICAHGEIFRHGHAREHLPSLRHVRKAHGDDAAGVGLAQIVPVIDDRAALDRHEAGDGVQRGGLSGTVGPDERDDLAVVDLHADAAQRLHSAVRHLQIFNLQHRRPPPLRRDMPR